MKHDVETIYRCNILKNFKDLISDTTVYRGMYKVVDFKPVY